MKNWMDLNVDGKIDSTEMMFAEEMLCTNLANAGMNPKALQYIMGHSNINMTLNYYAHATPDNAMAEMERLIA